MRSQKRRAANSPRAGQEVAAPLLVTVRRTFYFFLSASRISFMYLAGFASKSFLQLGQQSFTCWPLYTKIYGGPISPSLSPETGQVLSRSGTALVSALVSA